MKPNPRSASNQRTVPWVTADSLSKRRSVFPQCPRRDRDDAHGATFLVTRWDGEPVNTAPRETTPREAHDLRWFRPPELAGLKLADPAALSSILSAVRVATE